MTPSEQQGETTARAATTASNQRRRRKRYRPPQCGGAGRSRGDESSSKFVAGGRQDFCRDDDSRFAFLDKDGDDLIDGRAKFRSLPLLLEERKSGSWHAKQKRWQSGMLFNFTKKPAETYIARRQWRAFAHTKIPFTQLGSPPSDAVLAMERNGDYLLSLGNMDGDTHTGLALRFYGIHSVASRTRLRPNDPNNGIGNSYVPNKASTAPLLQTTPLHNGMRELDQVPEDSIAEDEILNLQRDFSPSTTPVELLISKDWKVGVALLHPPRNNGNLQVNIQENGNNPDADQTTSIVLFTLPRRQSQSGTIVHGSEHAVTRVFKCSNVPIFRNDSRRKLLWSVESIPNNDGISLNTTRTFYETYFRAPGYLIFLDEGDGFRLTWTTEKCFLVTSCLEEVSIDSRFVGGAGVSVGVNILSQEKASWEETSCRITTGEAVTSVPIANDTPLPAQVDIANESFLHLDVLLTVILSKRKGISETNPDFCYSLISLNRGGRVADFVIAFAREKKACSIAVFVKIDLFTGMFVELDWVQSKGKKDTVFLQKWCNTLAVNRRMREMRAGPFSVESRKALDCTRLCKETFAFDNDEEDDYDESYWRNFVLDEVSEGKKKRQAPKLVTMSSLYPCCDVITNHAITSFEPVMSIRAKDAPIQLVYT
uniref:Uncharacterized protein n=1 Tax=Pseudo-nitzschia australis TaxID=44445 RepID=A0A7S4EFZ9_9STRA|mmetsp:Transcript_18134/g.39536  ORF Transcript_18134/g.39536 Transcript_18134/m.39536 type:complete len:653 (-) Transcript_18134:27-1985(-)